MNKCRIISVALAMVAASLVALPNVQVPAQAKKEKTDLTDISMKSEKKNPEAAPLAGAYGLVKAMSMLAKKNERRVAVQQCQSARSHRFAKETGRTTA
jgi:hypothetical protein